MLLGKPYYLKWEHARKDRYANLSTDHIADSPGTGSPPASGQPEELTHEEVHVWLIQKTLEFALLTLGDLPYF